MKITIAICTWNHADLLDQTLDGMRKLHVPEGVELEILVVNNNCTDHTEEVIAKHAEHLPIRRLFEEEQGHTNARNCAVAAARGDLILWTDDDVLVDSQWLAEYARAAEAMPEMSFFGGLVEAHFADDPPNWLVEVWDSVANAYAVRDLGSEPFAFDQKRVPFGANFGVRTTVQRRYLFDPELGRKKDDLLGGDEVTVLRQMLADGLQGQWLPGARIRHVIPKKRQTLKYLRGYFFCQGRIAAMQYRERGGHRTVRRWLRQLRRAMTLELRYQIGRLFRRSEDWVTDLLQASKAWGRLLG